jgi:hypothetical protein
MKRAIMAATLLALAAAPCLAATKPAPPMTITRIDGRAVDPLIAFAEAAGPRSMVMDVALVVTMNVHGAAASPPPPKYDKTYANVEIVYDLPWHREGDAWGLTETPARPGGRCVIHLAPLGSALEEEDGIELLEPVGLERLLRHEYGHCNGLIHPDGKLDKWREVVGSEREKIAALVHRQWLEITGRREVAPARNAESATAAPPLKPRRDVAPSSPRAFSGEGY